MDATSENERVFALLEARLDVLLAQGKNVLVDATHARRAGVRRKSPSPARAARRPSPSGLMFHWLSAFSAMPGNRAPNGGVSALSHPNSCAPFI